jgi:hypothetical protein
MLSPRSSFCCIDAADFVHGEQTLCIIIKNVAVQAHRERENACSQPPQDW